VLKRKGEFIRAKTVRGRVSPHGEERKGPRAQSAGHKHEGCKQGGDGRENNHRESPHPYERGSWDAKREEYRSRKKRGT